MINKALIALWLVLLISLIPASYAHNNNPHEGYLLVRGYDVHINMVCSATTGNVIKITVKNYNDHSIDRASVLVDEELQKGSFSPQFRVAHTIFQSEYSSKSTYASVSFWDDFYTLKSGDKSIFYIKTYPSVKVNYKILLLNRDDVMYIKQGDLFSLRRC